MAEETQDKWEGKASIEVKGLKPEQVWPCLEDYGNLHKWHPKIDTCYLVEGVPGQPGLVRYCAGSKNPSSVKWAKDKLIMIKPDQRCLTYEITDNNMGIKSYVATIQVLPINATHGNNGCIVELSYVADPFEGWKFEDFVSYLDSSLQLMAKKMEHVLLHTAG